MSGAIVERSLYVLGGYIGHDYSDLIQKLSLLRLRWELCKVKLPCADYCIPCFKLRDSQVYFVMKKRLYALTSASILEVKALPGIVYGLWGPSHYSKGTLYCSNYHGAASRLELGL
jgi:hypothetical protein